MKLRTKLIVSFTLVIVLLLIIGGTSQYFNNKINNQVIVENRGAVKELEISGQLESNLYQSLINSQYYLDEPYRSTLSTNQRRSTPTIDKIRSNVRTSVQGIRRNLQEIEKLFQDDDYAQFLSQQKRDTSMILLRELKSKVMFYNSLIEQSVGYEQGNFQDGKEFLVVTIEPFFRNSLLPLVERFRSQIRSNLDQEVAQLKSRLSRYSNILLGATLLALLFAIMLGYVLYKSITIPIKFLADATQEIGRGNLEKRIEVKTDDEIGQLGTSFNRMAENLNKITFSKEYIDDIVESMGDALIVTDEQARIKKINSATSSLVGYSSSELIDQPLSIILTGKNKKELMSLGKRSKLDNYETHFKLKNGERLPVSLSKAFIHDNEGKIQGLVCVASDITERKKSEQIIRNSLKEKEILLSEIHHRVKNNLAVISGLLQMQIWETDNEIAEGVLQDSQMRVKSIALVHEKLYQSKNLSSIAFDTYILELLEGIENMYQNSKTDVTFKTDIAPVIFNINQAIPCSLLLNELVVNAYKHAFNGRSKGEISINLREENGLIILKVKDDGVGLDGQNNSDSKKSLGMSLINTLVEQLKGDIKAYSDGGASYKITFKLKDIT